jgi:hypothetical protein
MIGRYFFLIFLLFLGSVFVLDFKTEMFEIPFLPEITYSILLSCIVYYLLTIQLPKWRYLKRYFNTITTLSYPIYYFSSKQVKNELLKQFLLLILFLFFSIFYSTLFAFDFYFFVVSLYFIFDTFFYTLYLKPKFSYIITKKGIVVLNLTTDFISFKSLKSIELRDSILYFFYADSTMKSLDIHYLNSTDLKSFYISINDHCKMNNIIRNQNFYKSL